jgi:hypothetical protein
MWSAYDDDFEEVGLLGRERGPHGYDSGGAARRGAAARTLGRGKEGEGFWSRKAEGRLSSRAVWCRRAV